MSLEHRPELAQTIPSLNRAIHALVAAANGGKLIMACGNGGSAADADHIVGELMKGFLDRRPISRAERERIARTNPPAWEKLIDRLQWGIRAIALGTSTALTTAIANDLHADLIFAQQVFALGSAGDILIAISTSGESVNVLRAAEIAKALGITVIALSGDRDSSLRRVADISLCAPSHQTHLVQEFHVVIYHELCSQVERAVSARRSALISALAR